MGLDLAGKTLGIVGARPESAARVAQRLCGGWGNESVVYIARSQGLSLNSVMKHVTFSLMSLLRNSDFVSLHVPLSEATRKLIGAPELAMMKSTAVLINTARGEVLDQVALYETLRENLIFGAGLDVCEPEPLPADSPLRELTNCLVVPHIGSATITARNAMADRAARNLIAGGSGGSVALCRLGSKNIEIGVVSRN